MKPISKTMSSKYVFKVIGIFDSRLQRTDRAMIRWICGVRLMDKIPSGDLFSRLGLEDTTSVLRSRRLRWHGHVARASGGIHTITELVVSNGNRGRGRPIAWKDCVHRSIHECGLLDTDPQNRSAWRVGINSARLQPTPIAGTWTAGWYKLLYIYIHCRFVCKQIKIYWYPNVSHRKRG